jgi:hypothetical protein
MLVQTVEDLLIGKPLDRELVRRRLLYDFSRARIYFQRGLWRKAILDLLFLLGSISLLVWLCIVVGTYPLLSASLQFELLHFLPRIELSNHVKHIAQVATGLPRVMQTIVTHPFDLVLIVTTSGIDSSAMNGFNLIALCITTTLVHLIIISPARSSYLL